MKRLLFILLVPLLLVLGGAVLAPKLAPEERLRGEAVAALRTATGEEPHIGGDVSFAIFPWPSIRIADLSIGRADGIALIVPEAGIELELLPLLTGQARMERVVLHDPRLSLPGASWPDDATFAQFVTRLGETAPAIEIKVDGGAVLVPRRGVPEVALRGIDGEFRWRGGRLLSAEGDAEWRGERIDFEMALADLAELAAGGAARLRIALGGTPGEANFTGTARIAGGPVAEGDLRIASPALRAMLAWLGTAAPTDSGFGPLELNARALLSSNGAALSAVQLDLDGNRTDGGVILRRELGRTVVQGSFAGSRLDLSPYGRVSLADADGGWSRLPIEVARLGMLDLDLRLSAGEVHVGETSFEDVAASAILKGGRLVLTVGEARAWQGIFQASVNIAPPASGVVDAGADVRVELEGTDVDLEASLGDLFRLQRLAGTGTFHVALAGYGGNVADIVDNLAGTVTLSAAPGALLGIDVERMLARLQRSPLSGAGAQRGGRTPFDTLEARATVAQGVAHLDRLDLASPAVRIGLEGDVSLPRRDLDLKGSAGLVTAAATASGDGFELPFVVQGPWDSPFVLPDPQALIRRSGAARPLLGTGAAAAVGVSSPAP